MQRIDFNYELDFKLVKEKIYRNWIQEVIVSEGYSLGVISYIFCTDDYLLKIHQKYLGKNTYTDIITFDYCDLKVVSGDIFISIERLKENSNTFKCSFEEELLRVMSHGLLHLMGYKDKCKDDVHLMRNKENEKLKMFHVEQ